MFSQRIFPIFSRRSSPLFIATGTAGALGLYLYHKDDTIKHTTANGREAAHLSTISVRNFQTKIFLRPPDGEIGEQQTESHILLGHEDSKDLLLKREKSTLVSRPGNPVIRWDTNVLGANAACEDRHAIDLIRKDELGVLLAETENEKSYWEKWFGVRTSILSPKSIEGDQPGKAKEGDGRKDLVMFSVFDGHSGWAVSHLLHKLLHPCLAYAIASQSELKTGNIPRDHPNTLISLISRL